MSLSTAQVRDLELIAKATDENRGHLAPHGPSGRPAKFLKNAGLVEERTNATGLWITAKGREELDRQKNGPKP